MFIESYSTQSRCAHAGCKQHLHNSDAVPTIDLFRKYSDDFHVSKVSANDADSSCEFNSDFRIANGPKYVLQKPRFYCCTNG